jgi:hypothetical protein
MEITATNKREVETSMLDKIRQIEEEVEIEKQKSRDCQSAIKKSIVSLRGLLNGEEPSEEEEAEAQELVLGLGGNNDDSK